MGRKHSFLCELPHILLQISQALSFLSCAGHFAYISILQIFHWLAIHLSGFRPPHTIEVHLVITSNFPLGTALPLVLSINVSALFPSHETLPQVSDFWSGCDRRENSFCRFILRTALWRHYQLLPYPPPCPWFLSFLRLGRSTNLNRSLLCLN